MRRAALISFCIGFAALAGDGAETSMGISRIPMTSLNSQDQSRINLDFVYLQMLWNWAQYREVSKFQVPEAESHFLDVEFRGTRRRLSVVQLRHVEKVLAPRRLVVMVSGLFASEWQDLKRAKWFYDQGYDVLKVPTAFSESFINAFPMVDPGDLDAEAQILVQAVLAYRTQYGIENQSSAVVAYGTSYGASVVLKAAELNPHQVFSRVLALSPVFDFSRAMKVFDAVMASSSKDSGALDPNTATGFLMSVDPQSMSADDRYEFFARNEVVKALLKKMRLYCVVRYKNQEAARNQCVQITSFAKLLEHMKIKPLTGKLASIKDQRVFVLTTENDPFNSEANQKSTLLAIGHTLTLEKGGHFGYVGSEVEQKFITTALNEN